MIRGTPIAPFLPLIPETRNLCRFLVSGINGKIGTMGFFSDHKSSSAGSTPVSPNKHGINQCKNHTTIQPELGS
jgi:hypothetical protein